jgi:hypothetical protein
MPSVHRLCIYVDPIRQDVTENIQRSGSDLAARAPQYAFMNKSITAIVQVQVDLPRSGGCVWLINGDRFGRPVFFWSLIVF